MRYSGYLFTNRRTTCEPMNPAPPVIIMFLLGSARYHYVSLEFHDFSVVGLLIEMSFYERWPFGL